MGVDDLLNTISSVIAPEEINSNDFDDDNKSGGNKNPSLRSIPLPSTIGSEVSNAIDVASDHLNNFIGNKSGANGDTTAILRKKYSNNSLPSTFGSEVSNAIDVASDHLNNFIGNKSGGANDDTTATLRKYSNLCIITCRFGDEFSLLIRVKNKNRKRERFGRDGRAALARAHFLGYRTRCREVERLVCSIGGKGEEMIVFVLSY